VAVTRPSGTGTASLSASGSATGSGTGSAMPECRGSASEPEGRRRPTGRPRAGPRARAGPGGPRGPRPGLPVPVPVGPGQPDSAEGLCSSSWNFQPRVPSASDSTRDGGVTRRAVTDGGALPGGRRAP